MKIVESRMSSMNIQEILKMVRATCDRQDLICKNIAINDMKSEVAILVSDLKCGYMVGMDLEGYFVGYLDSEFKEIEGLDLDLSDDGCPVVRVFDSEEAFDMWTHSEEGETYVGNVYR